MHDKPVVNVAFDMSDPADLRDAGVRLLLQLRTLPARPGVQGDADRAVAGTARGIRECLSGEPGARPGRPAPPSRPANRCASWRIRADVSSTSWRTRRQLRKGLPRMSPVDTAKLYFEAVPWRCAIRCGASAPHVHPAEFVDSRGRDLARRRESVSEEEVQARFRASRHAAISARSSRMPRVSRRCATRAIVLVIGCGPGLRDAAPHMPRPSCARCSHRPDRLSRTLGSNVPLPADSADGPYDLVVTHSLLHFIHDPRPVCRLSAAD